MKLNWNFLRGGGVTGQIPSVGGYGYFLEPHIGCRMQQTVICESYKTFLDTSQELKAGLIYPLKTVVSHLNCSEPPREVAF